MLLISAQAAQATITASPNPSTGNYTVSWTPVSGAIEYRLLQSSNGGATWTTYYAFSTSRSFVGVLPGSYLYKVNSCVLRWRRGEPIEMCRPTNYPTITVTVNDAIPPVPTGLNGPTTDHNGAYTVSWNASTGAATYRLQEKVGSGSWVQIHNNGARSKALSGNSPGTYSYRVRACNASSNCSSWSSSITVTVASPPPAPTVSGPTTDYNGAYSVSWSAVTNASTYRLEERVGSGAWSQIYSGSGLSRTISGKSAGSYSYRARGCNAESVCGSWSSTKTVTVVAPPAAPTGLLGPATSYTGAYTMSWNASSTATTYRLDEQIGASTTWNQVHSGSGLSKVVSGKSAGVYKYRVRACNTESVCGSWSSTFTVTVENPPSVPGGLSGPGSDADGAYSVSWNPSAGSTSYRLEELPPSGSWTEIYTGSSTAKSVTGRSDGTYSYRVRGCNDDNICSDWSDPVVVMVSAAPTPPPAPPQPATHTDPGVSKTSDEIGTTAGKFRVDESGAASYSVPIIAVDGTAGVAPSISINYSSNGGNGIAGMGWSIGGLSAITRCRQTYDQDRNPQPIGWSGNDRFCLDGQRLVLHPTTQTTYGAADSTYRTEVDSGAIVTIRGNVSGEPDYFEVSRKDGSVSYYGESPNAPADQSAKHGGGAGKTLVWAVREFADNVGNPIWFDYHDDGFGHRIDQIRWAYGSGRTPESGANARMTFHYDDRYDIKSGYVSGTRFETSKKLAAIRSYNNVVSDVLIREYNLYYNENISASDNLNRLTSIEECVGNTCLPRTRFDWNIPVTSAALVLVDSISLAESNNLSDFTLADINGDGLMDLVWLEGATANAILNFAIFNGSSYVQAPFVGGGNEYALPYGGESLTVLDYNLDGRDDIAYWDDDSGFWRIVMTAPQNDGTWKLKRSAIPTPITYENATFVDIDSNGTTDALFTGTGMGYKQILLSRLVVEDPADTTSSNYYHFTAPVPVGSPNVNTLGKIRTVAADFDGDGRIGIIFGGTLSFQEDLLPPINFYEHNAKALNIINPGSPNPTYQVYSDLNAQGPIFGNEYVHTDDLVVTDINGDGLSDLFYPIHIEGTGESNQFHLAINEGDGSFNVTEYVESTIEADDVRRPQFVDWNSDGYPDLVWKKSSGGSALVYVRYWNAETGLLDPKVVLTGASTSLDESIYFPDVNGDGVPDVLKIDTGNGAGTVRAYTRKSGPTILSRASNRIRSVTNGLGATTSITYEPLSYTAHYERLTYDTGTPPGPVNCINGTQFEPICIEPTPVEVSAAGFYDKINGDWDLPDTWQSLGKNAPVLEMAGPMYVVTRIVGSAPAAGATPANVVTSATSEVQYFYKQANMQAAGRGFLGFEQLVTEDMQSGVRTTTRYRQDWPFTGLPIASVVTSADGIKLSASNAMWEIYEWDASTRSTASNAGTAALGSIHVLQYESHDETFALAASGVSQGSHLITVSTESVYDAEGNADWMRVTTRNELTGIDEQVVVTDNEYDLQNFELWDGRLSRTEVTTTRPTDSGLPRISTFDYYASGVYEGMLWTETVNPGTPLELVTEYAYDPHGNRNKAAVTATDDNITRCDVVFADYESSGRYVDRRYDCVGNLTSEVTDRSIFGSPTRIDKILDVTNTSARMTTYVYYGALGREYFRWRADGSSTQVYLSASQGNCPVGTAYRATTTKAGGKTGETCFDLLMREVRTLTLGFDGQWDAQDTEYDKSGRVVHKSEPFDLAGPGSVAPYWVTMHYDLLGRVIKTDLPDNSWGKTHYNNFDKVSENYKLQQRTETMNSLGELVSTLDELGGGVTYTYDRFGNLATMTNVDGSITQTLYNDVGQKYYMSDPNQGVWHYEYNGFGEVERQINANNQSVEFTYDGLGRIKTRIDRKVAGCTTTGASCVEGSAVWVYDTAPNGLGNLDSVQDIYSGYLRSILYDSLGRVDETATNFDGGIYYERATYDQYGRPYQIFDAAGDGSFTDHGTVSRYNAFGYLESVGDAVQINGGPRTIYREVTQMNARGQVVSELLGIDENGNAAVTTSFDYHLETGRIKDIDSVNAAGVDVQDLYYEWDSVGNLTLRREHSGSKQLEESFGYDDLNRLTSQSVVGQDPIEVTYYANGNIRTKTGVSGIYSYGEGAGPHAVTGANGKIYMYDANGNNVADDDRIINYYTFDKPSSISKDGHTTSFAYGPDRNRFRRIDESGAGTTTTRYVGDVEIISRDDGTEERKRYIAGAAIETTFYSNGSETGRDTVYTFFDHLGSMDVITDASGDIAQELSFGAWGQRRDAINWAELDVNDLLADLGPAFDTSITTRGFTGHEMVDAVGVIHMNGRIYDPILGRFLQADPHVQDVASTQNQNRYTYVLNNPLNATDPSGYFIFSLIAMVIVANATIDLGIIAIASIFFAAGTLDALAAGANLSDAFMAGLFSGISAGAFTKIGGFLNANFSGSFAGGLTKAGFAIKIFAHGAVGGITSVLQGGKFGHGFAAAFATASATSFNNSQFIGGYGFSKLRVVVGAVIGGTISKMTGGKFANGAITGAFSQALNNEAHEKAVDDFVKKLEAMGHKVKRGLQITVRVGGEDVVAIADFAYLDDGELVLGEVKTGKHSRFTQNQKKAYFELLDAVENKLFAMSNAGREFFGLAAGKSVPRVKAITFVMTAGSRAVRQVGKRFFMKGSGKLLTGVVTFLGSSVAFGAEMLLTPSELGLGMDCTYCMIHDPVDPQFE